MNNTIYELDIEYMPELGERYINWMGELQLCYKINLAKYLVNYRHLEHPNELNMKYLKKEFRKILDDNVQWPYSSWGYEINPAINLDELKREVETELAVKDYWDYVDVLHRYA